MPGDENGSVFSRLGQRGLVGRMHEQLDELLASRDQMEQLLALNIEIGVDLDLDATLGRIVTAARQLTGARYGALGVRGADGRLMSFVHAGMDADTVARLGDLPVGKGLLGVLLNQPDIVRLSDLTAHPAAVGFPEHHPPMRAFLGVPIIIREAAFGSLYLGDDRPGQVFNESHENAVRALASVAAVAIDNAHLFDQVSTTAQWTAASREITTAVLSGGDSGQAALSLIAERVCELTAAEQAIVLLSPDPELPADHVNTLTVAAAAGVHIDDVHGQQVAVDGSTIGTVFRTGTPVITEVFRHPIAGFTDVGQRPAIVMALHVGETALGAIAAARSPHQPPLDPRYLDLAADFAGHAALALTLAAGRDHERERSILADRERIAHDLHDHVIQKLFAAGLDLQGTIARSHSPDVVDRLTRTVDELQSTIEDIRTTIFRLNTAARSGEDFRQRIHTTITDLTEDRDIQTTVTLSGPMSVIGAELAQHAAAILTEAISNTVRHSRATRLAVHVAVADELAIDIIDNGQGIPADNQRRSGLANMARRAEKLCGTCHFTTPEHGGTHVRFTAPLTDL